MHIVICDDEENTRSYIRKLIETYMEKYTENLSDGCLEAQAEAKKQIAEYKMTEFCTGTELLQYDEQQNGRKSIDILFLDVSLRDLDGMTVAKQLRSRKENRQEAVWGSLPLLIFMTGYPEDMQEAFSVNAFQYIVKPIREDEFVKVFSQAVREFCCLTIPRQAPPKEILVKNGSTTRTVPTEDVFYIESNSRKVILYLLDETLEYYDKIGALENELKPEFFRIHKGYLVNMKYIERYNRTEVFMKNGDSLLISKYKYQDFVKAYMKYLSKER